MPPLPPLRVPCLNCNALRLKADHHGSRLCIVAAQRPLRVDHAIEDTEQLLDPHLKLQRRLLVLVMCDDDPAAVVSEFLHLLENQRQHLRQKDGYWNPPVRCRTGVWYLFFDGFS